LKRPPFLTPLHPTPSSGFFPVGCGVDAGR
jgi:hypothetical protein